MKRIIIHWSAGAYKPNASDLEHYHFVIDDKGKIYNGKYKPKDNENCCDGVYAAHTGGGNTGSIGVSMACMFGYVNRDNVGSYPMTKLQFESCMNKVAQLCKEYDIAISSNTVMTHYEFGLKNPKTSSAGKIDINFIPPYPWVTPAEAGKFIRNKVKWYFERL